MTTLNYGYVPAEVSGLQRVEIFIDHILPALQDGPSHAPPHRRNVPARQAGPVSRGVGTGIWEQLLKGGREGRNDE